MLIYFINEDFNCPKIILTDWKDEIVLNTYFDDYWWIQKIANETIFLWKKKEKFIVKVFKIFHSEQKNNYITLTAHNRAVSQQQMEKYVPEFEWAFEEVIKENKRYVTKKFTIQAYVIWDYLDKNVSIDRWTFNFCQKEEWLWVFEISDIEIERESINIVLKYLNKEIEVRKKNKKDRIINYINNSAPWHISYINDLDLSSIAVSISDTQLEMELRKLKNADETSARIWIEAVLWKEYQDRQEEVDDLVKKITKASQSDLAHYVANRKVIIKLFSDYLRYADIEKKDYNPEKAIHNLIFPMNSDSKSLPFDSYNLWLIDETLSFSEYISSDKHLRPKWDKPDILLFWNKVVVWELSEWTHQPDANNPISIVEFKKPGRDNYKDESNPIKQIFRYVKEIRDWKAINLDWLHLVINPTTPAYWFVIATLTDSLKKLPDGKWYFWYHSKSQVYMQVISYEKLITDAEKRNRIFFKKLWING